MQSPATPTQGPGAVRSSDRSFVATVVFIALSLSIALVVLAVERASTTYLPGEGAYGTDATRFGPRVLWSRLEVPPRPPGAIPADRGEKLYTQWCASCHGDKGAGDGILSKALAPPPRNFTRARFRLRSTPDGSLPSDGDLFRTISVGIVVSRMPAFSSLPVEDRWALVDHVKRLSAFYDEDEQKTLNHFELNPPDPEVRFDQASIATDEAAVARGKKLWLEKGECWKCHGTEGLGDGPSAPTLKSEEETKLLSANLQRGPAGLKSVANVTDVFRVLNLGIAGTPMPSYAKSMTQEELKDLSAYATSLWAVSPRPGLPGLPMGNTRPTARESLVTTGEITYLTNCAGCHGKLGRGDGTAAAGFAVRPANLAAGFFKFKTTEEGSYPSDEDLKRTLRRGVPGSSMPAWNLHSEAELDAVVAFLKELGGSRARQGPLMPVAVPPAGRVGTPESIAAGQKLFAANCAVCHGNEGAGDGSFAPILTDYRGEKLRPRNLREEPLKYGERAEEVFRTITYGFEGTPMPGFAAALDDAQRYDLVSYVLSIRPPYYLAHVK